MSLIYTKDKRLKPKDPSAGIDYAVEVTDAPEDVTVVSATITITPSGSLEASAVTCGGTRATARFTGGTAGVDYTATFSMVLSDGQTPVDSIIIPVRER